MSGSSSKPTSTKKYTVDKSKPVLVTGADGYIAGVLIKELLSEGVTVHGTVQDPSQKDRLQYLHDLSDSSPGTLKLFKADLLIPGSFEDGMRGCSIVFHVASPIGFKTDPKKEMIEPAVRGTEQVLKTASKTPSVKRVILTSSVGAIFTALTETYQAPGQKLTEDVWNRTATVDYMPYCLSKTLAEQKAWTVAGSQNQWKLVVINPGVVFGPGITYHPNSLSVRTIKFFGDGTMARGCGPMGFGIVDVRDVAKAHVAAAYIEGASGRHIAVGHNANLMDMALAIADKYAPEYPVPTKPVPTLLILLLAPYLPTGKLHRWFVWNTVNVKPNFDNSKAKNELGIDFRPLKETAQDMFQQLIDDGAFEK